MGEGETEINYIIFFKDIKDDEKMERKNQYFWILDAYKLWNG